jgi:hypothetical protein
MIDRVTESEYAYLWALDIGNRDVMKSHITEPEWIVQWNKTFLNDKIVV